MTAGDGLETCAAQEGGRVEHLTVVKAISEVASGSGQTVAE
jgi:hypothetical protein